MAIQTDSFEPTRRVLSAAPVSPYGSSKLMTEIMLADTARAHDFRYVALRYFNVAGADPKGRTGQSTPDATHLIKVAVQAAHTFDVTGSKPSGAAWERTVRAALADAGVGAGAVGPRPWVVGGTVVPRQVIALSLGADHRVTDGRLGAQFLARIAERVAAPDSL
jgi:hypothetical protein